jgi:Caldesmon.
MADEILKSPISSLPAVTSLENTDSILFARGTKAYRASPSILGKPSIDAANDARAVLKNLADAESLRVIAESGRVSAEATRKSNETTRVSSEETRVSNESTRKTAEEARVKAEATRESNETTRKNNETTRVDNESTRQANENTRVSNEDTRLVDEQLRNSAENTRVSNEDTRLTQEEARENATIQALVDTEEATNRLNNLSDNRDKIVDGFWWRYDEDTDEFYNTDERANGDVLLPTFHVDPDGDLIMTKPEQLTELDFEVNGKDLIMKINI